MARRRIARAGHHRRRGLAAHPVAVFTPGGGKQVAGGEEWVADLNYTHGLSTRMDTDPLRYEKRMLNLWFKARFVDALAATG